MAVVDASREAAAQVAEPVQQFFAVLAGQRAHRAFRDDPVDDATVERLLWAATRAPSAENLQPWFFVVVREKRRRAALGEVTRRAWEGGGRDYALHRLDPSLLADVDAGARGGVASAPALVVVCADTRVVHARTVGPSIFPAVQNLLLAATALGLGSALTTLPLAFAEEVAALLELPEKVEPEAVVPVGWPARPLRPGSRHPVHQVARRETFRQGW